MATDARYREHAVAFVDLLGFREASKNADYREGILSLLKAIAQLRGDLGAETEQITDPTQLRAPPKLRGFPNFTFAMVGQRTVVRPAITAFSDSIVISFCLDELQKHNIDCGDAVHFLQWMVSYLAWNALDIGLLIRGGITIGELHHEDGVIVGSGLIDAYDLETKVAIYPRVVLSRTVVEHPLCKPRATHFLYTDYDGMPCLDYMPGVLQRISGTMERYIGPQVERVRNLAAERIAALEQTGDLRKLAKWRYFSNYFEGSVHRLEALIANRD